MNVVKKCEHEWDKKRRGWGNEEEWSEEGNMKKGEWVSERISRVVKARRKSKMEDRS